MNNKVELQKEMDDFKENYKAKYMNSEIEQSKEIYKQMGYDYAKGRNVPGFPAPYTNIPPLVKDVLAAKNKFKNPADYKRALLKAYQGNASGYIKNVDDFEAALKMPGGYTKYAADKKLSSILDKMEEQGYITVYRGLDKKPTGPFGTSWTVDKSVAEEFSLGYVMKMKIKRSEIFELGAYGYKTELEIFVPTNAKRKDFSYYRYHYD